MDRTTRREGIWTGTWLPKCLSTTVSYLLKVALMQKEEEEEEGEECEGEAGA